MARGLTLKWTIILVGLALAPALLGCEKFSITKDILPEVNALSDSLIIEKIEEMPIETAEEPETFIVPKFEDVRFFSIPEDEQWFYLQAINSIPLKYFEELNGIDIYNPDKNMMQRGGFYYIDTMSIRTNVEKTEFKDELIHNLAHHQVFMEDGIYRYENAQHKEVFINKEQEILNA